MTVRQIPSALLSEYPLPWAVETDMVRAANGARVWDFGDANDDPDLAEAVVNLVNSLGDQK